MPLISDTQGEFPHCRLNELHLHDAPTLRCDESVELRDSVLSRRRDPEGCKISAPTTALNVAPNSIGVVSDEEWLGTSVEQGSDDWLMKGCGLTELVKYTTATFYSSLDTIDVQDPRDALVADARSPRTTLLHYSTDDTGTIRGLRPRSAVTGLNEPSRYTS